MRTIPLSQGQVAFVDDDDFEKVSAFKWSLHRNPKSRAYYARRNIQINGKQKNQMLHRFILDLPPGRTPEVDHRDGDGLNNCRSNLRIATCTQNQQARRKQRAATSSKFKGVTWDKNHNRWRAQIMVNNKQKFLGYFKTEEEAARAYDLAASANFANFARINGHV